MNKSADVLNDLPSTIDLRQRLAFHPDRLEAINKVMLNPDNQAINEFLAVVKKYGTPQEINQKAGEASQMPVLLEKVLTTKPEYLDDLQWLDPATVNGTAFGVFQGSVPVPGSITIDNVSVFTFTPDAPLAFGVTYTVIMPAGGIGDVLGNRLPAPIVTSFTTEPLPQTTINDLFARAKDSKIDIVWTPLPGAARYNVYRGTSPGGPYDLIAAGHVTGYAVYADFGLVNGTTYYYVVTSVAGGVESLPSNEASATPVSGRTRRR